MGGWNPPDPLKVFIYCAKTFGIRELNPFLLLISTHGSFFAVAFIDISSTMLPWQIFY